MLNLICNSSQWSVLPLPVFPSRSEHSNGHVGYVQPVSDGDGSHMHHNVPQQRGSIFPQASIHLLYSVRSVDAPSSCTDSRLTFQGHKDAKPTVSTSGILVLLCLVVFHQSLLALLASDHTVPLSHQFSWSVSCIGCAGAVLIVGGILFLLLALPYSPWKRCLPRKDSSS